MLRAFTRLRSRLNRLERRCLHEHRNRLSLIDTQSLLPIHRRRFTTSYPALEKKPSSSERSNAARRSGSAKSKTTRASATPKSSRQLKKQSSAQGLDNIAQIKALPGYPSKDQFSNKLLETLTRNPKTLLHDSLKGFVDINESRTQVKGGHQCSVNIDWKDGSRSALTATGVAASKAQAMQRAWLRLAVLLNQEGLLKDLISTEIDKVSDEVRRDEKQALSEIYEYCIREGELPIIERTTRRVRRHRAYVTSITFAKQQIHVSAVTQRTDSSDLLAAIKFKRAAEKYHAARGTSSLVVKAQDALNVTNAEQFFVYYSMVRGHSDRPAITQKQLPYDQFQTDIEFSHSTHDINVNIIGPTKKSSERLAYLIAAHNVMSAEPDLKDGFFHALKMGNGNILTPVRPLDLEVDGTTARVMEATLMEAREKGLGDFYEPLSAEDNPEVDTTEDIRASSPIDLDSRNIALAKARETYLASPKLETLRHKRYSLPMAQYAKEVLELIEKNVYSIIIGETGSGKTTQVPQILLDHYVDRKEGTKCNVICTQPRRIAATSVATRVAEERGEVLRQSIGYSVRGKYQRATKPGHVNYCTTGILLAQLQNDPDKVMNNTSHIILDEVHERDRLIDYTMIILKQVIGQRLTENKPVPKVTLMSATLDPKLFSSYFRIPTRKGTYTNAPILRVPGRTFPVAEQHLEQVYDNLKKAHPNECQTYVLDDRKTAEYLDAEREFAAANHSTSDPSESSFLSDSKDSRNIIDWKRQASTTLNQEEDSSEKDSYVDGLVPTRLVAATIAHIAATTSEGAILAFLPGLDEIQAVEKELNTNKLFGQNFTDESLFSMYILHSSVSDSQTSVFEPVPEGKRKIILSTNIAETSVTIPDVQHVVDTGKHREIQYDQKRRLTALRCGWISKSNAKQRAGRAGRVQNGNYYALFSRSRRDTLRAVGLPELLRTDLQETCLEIVAQKWPLPPREFLASAVEPPDPVAVDRSMNQLVRIEALTSDERLTPLGRLLSSLPIHPELGKMVVWGIIFKCLDPMIILGAMADARPLFVQPLGPARKDANRSRAKFSANTYSDHIATLNAFREVRAIMQRKGFGAARDFAFRNHIHWGAFSTIRATASMICETLEQAGLVSKSRGSKGVELGGDSLNVNSEKVHVVKALATAGLYPKLAVKPALRLFHWRTENELEVHMHPGSINKEAGMHLDGRKPAFAIFDQLARSNDGKNLSIRNTSFVSPLAVVLFSGRLAPRGESHGDDPWDSSGRKGRDSRFRVIEVDKWLPFFVQSPRERTARTIVELRKALQRMLVKAYADLNKGQSLVEDPVRAVFSRRMVDLLSLDVHRQDLEKGRATPAPQPDAIDKPRRRAHARL